MSNHDAIYNATYDALSPYTVRLYQQFDLVAYEMARPSTIQRPALSIDGDMWCALYGENLQDGVAGFGKSPAEAMTEFDKAWHQQTTPRKTAADCINDIRYDLAEIVSAT